MTIPNEMPDEIWASPRGSGTVSGVWCDVDLGDEPETSYTRTSLLEQRAKLAAEKLVAKYTIVNYTDCPSGEGMNLASVKEIASIIIKELTNH